ncbi:unnamed protein product [Pleuronectes platessa]|uniref:Secreted protein n=1 Tax=Pleuronectes platessa TaxID=8262 RepID=A0A9N7UMF3_PLEPL|nr:unnamed protein product [Pleuronectes platessa]
MKLFKLLLDLRLWLQSFLKLLLVLWCSFIDGSESVVDCREQVKSSDLSPVRRSHTRFLTPGLQTVFTEAVAT